MNHRDRSPPSTQTDSQGMSANANRQGNGLSGLPDNFLANLAVRTFQEQQMQRQQQQPDPTSNLINSLLAYRQLNATQQGSPDMLLTGVALGQLLSQSQTGLTFAQPPAPPEVASPSQLPLQAPPPQPQEKAPVTSATETSRTTNVPAQESFLSGFPQPPDDCMMLPCKARGMPPDHNIKNAYFVIPMDTKHGEELMCSYQGCCGHRAKFLFCKYCRMPVARRYFRKKHEHRDILEAESKDSSCELVSPVQQVPAALKEELETAAAVSYMGGAGDVSSEASANEGIYSRYFHQEVMAATCAKRRWLWARLLGYRPDIRDTSAMKDWMQQVIATSDLDFPVDRLDPSLVNRGGQIDLRKLYTNIPEQILEGPLQAYSAYAATRRSTITTDTDSSKDEYGNERMLGVSHRRRSPSPSIQAKSRKKFKSA